MWNEKIAKKGKGLQGGGGKKKPAVNTIKLIRGGRKKLDLVRKVFYGGKIARKIKETAGVRSGNAGGGKAVQSGAGMQGGQQAVDKEKNVVAPRDSSQTTYRV